MFGFLKKKFDASIEDRRYYHSQYEIKLNEIEGSFDQLKQTTASVIKQATGVTESLKRNIELFEKRFNAIANAIDNVIIIKTINRQWISVNDFTCQLLGINKEVCLGKTNEQVVEIYPQLKSIINILDDAEKYSWDHHQPETITMPIEKHEYQVMIKPVETSDKMANELVLIGKKVR